MLKIQIVIGGEKDKGLIMFAKEWSNILLSATLMYISAMFLLVATNVLKPSSYLISLEGIPSFLLIIIAFIFIIVAFALMSYGDRQ